MSTRRTRTAKAAGCLLKTFAPRTGGGLETHGGDPVTVGPSVKMSKSKKNVIDPEEIIERFGADTARWFILSDSPPDRDVEWTTSGIEAASRHLQRVWRLVSSTVGQPDSTGSRASREEDNANLFKAMHRTIDSVTNDLESFSFNKSVAALYEFTSTLARSTADPASKAEAFKVLAQLMQPITPHLAEEIWEMAGGEGLVLSSPWPVADPDMLVEDTVVLPVQVNGKRRAEVPVAKGLDRDEVEALVLDLGPVRNALGGRNPQASGRCSRQDRQCGCLTPDSAWLWPHCSFLELAGFSRSMVRGPMPRGSSGRFGLNLAWFDATSSCVNAWWKGSVMLPGKRDTR